MLIEAGAMDFDHLGQCSGTPLEQSDLEIGQGSGLATTRPEAHYFNT